MSDKRIAVLIDADNVSSKYINNIMNEMSNHGTPTYKRIYGDWTSAKMTAWKDVLLEHSVSPMQQYSYTTGKNATDAALIIDAMDILYSGRVDGFCIVSSDSDFTKLATRLREAGMLVIGMGEKKTPVAFRAACDMFKYLEVLASVAGNGKAAEEEAVHEEQVVQGETAHKEKGTTDAKKNPPNNRERAKLIRTIRTIVNEISDEDGWAFLGELGSILNRRLPDFDTRNYGAMKLTPLIESLGNFDIESRKTSNPHVTHKYIRNRDKG
jgi:predicted nuclease of predicted toxin-antitoxin system